VLKKVNTLLAPLTECVDAYDTDDVRLALLSWCASALLVVFCVRARCMRAAC
jgi:hypothetical protein